MCGIAGFWQRDTGIEDPQLRLQQMTARLAHRGPDDHGHWFDSSTGIGLGQRRLSVIDLSPEGHQPMFSASGRLVIVFNGEIYNYEDLRRQLGPRGWRGHSDTEVFLEAIEEWGLAEAVSRSVGMFAFALWDRSQRTLSLVRDRLGIKPLYYATSGKALLFGSQPKAFFAWPEFEAAVDRNSLTLYLRYNYIPAPYTIYTNTRKLQPGTFATFHQPDAEPEIFAYWTAEETAANAVQNPFRGSFEEATEHLDTLIRDAVKLRMIADVPLGAFLSGGIDSSTVVALMQAQSSRKVRSFSIGFREASYNEADCAKRVAEHLGTNHTELYVTPAEAMAVVPKLPEMYDEPFADSSQIPTFLVSQLAREQVTVALSGDGGDELFGGYNRYVWATQVWNSVRRTPKGFRRALASGMLAVPGHTWDGLAKGVAPLLPGRLRFRQLGSHAHKIASLFALDGPDRIYRQLVSTWEQPSELVREGIEPETQLDEGQDRFMPSDPVARMMITDAITYLPDDILAKVDRASMGVALEARVPLLDHRVFEYAWRLPSAYKFDRKKGGKLILRHLLERYVPVALTDRPKMGFGVPVGDWIRGPLSDWAEALLDPNRLQQQGFLQPGLVGSTWREHLAGRGQWANHLWAVLMFESWLEWQRSARFESVAQPVG
jgi:asparagine synthase (glutamine-hydrolysing)